MADTLTVFFQLAYQAYFPSLVDRSRLIEGNSKLQISASVDQVGGPGLAGIIIGWLTAPIAILVDALSFLLSGVSIMLIDKKESLDTSQQKQSNMIKQIGDGFRLIFTNRYLRAMVGEAATYNLFSNWIYTLFILYVVQELKIDSVTLGFMFAVGSIGALIGSMMAEKAAKSFGLGFAFIGATGLACIAPMLMILTNDSGPFSIFITVLYLLLNGIGLAISNIHVVSLRQAITPENLFGRMNASYRFIGTGFVSLGSLIGGYLGQILGLKTALILGAVCMPVALLWLFFSPLTKLKELPVRVEECV